MRNRPMGRRLDNPVPSFARYGPTCRSSQRSTFEPSTIPAAPTPSRPRNTLRPTGAPSMHSGYGRTHPRDQQVPPVSQSVQAPRASTSEKPASTDLAKSAASGIASESVLIPMQQVPQCERSVTFAAVPDSGPNGYNRSSSAPATYSGNGEPGTLLVTKSDPFSM